MTDLDLQSFRPIKLTRVPQRSMFISLRVGGIALSKPLSDALPATSMEVLTSPKLPDMMVLRPVPRSHPSAYAVTRGEITSVDLAKELRRLGWAEGRHAARVQDGVIVVERAGGGEENPR